MAISAVFVCACASQLAQAWYMYPELREIIESDDVFENYNAIAHNYLGTSQQRAVAILSSPFVESRMLLLERDGEGTLQIRDQLFAPLRGDTGRMGSDWTVKSTGQGFQLINSDEGQTAYEMTFVYDENRAGYVLEDAVTPQMAFCYDATVDGYMAEDPDGYDRMFWYGGRITLEEFCPDMLPDSYDEVWTSRVIRAGLADLRPISAKMPLVLEGDDKMAVYAAPSSKAYRGANGKACVYADEEIWIRGQTGDGKWWLVEYTVSDDRGRIGYIKANTSEGTVYYFSAVNVEGAISLSKAAEIAYNDTKDAWQKVGTKVYCYRFVGDNKLFSRYAPSVQESLKKYFAPAAPAPETNPAQ